MTKGVPQPEELHSPLQPVTLGRSSFERCHSFVIRASSLVIRVPWLTVIVLLLSVAGCAGYRFGAASLFPQDIRTVYVPVFESHSFRRNLGEWLTEAVIKEIERRTTYKVAGSANADSVLTGVILSDSKRIVVENPLDEPRLAEFILTVQVTWADRRSGELIRQGAVAVPPEVVELALGGRFAPEVGQSVTTAQQQAIERLAEQIVDLMEAAW
jgi:hypothetical protein